MGKRIILIDHHDNLGDDLATRYLAELGFENDLRCPFRGDPLPQLDDSIAGAVIFGGAQNLTEIKDYPFLRTEMTWIQKALDKNLPLLGICLGAQLIARALGARVGPHPEGLCEFGYYEIEPVDRDDPLFSEPMYVTQAHFQQFELPPGAVALFTGATFPNQAFRYRDQVYGLQFHPEVTQDIFRRWQDSDWAPYGKPGAQDRDIQDRIIESADRVQAAWFRNLLESLFIHATAAQAA